MSGTEDGIKAYVFLMATHVAKVKKFALGPLFLGSWYAKLDEYANKNMHLMGRYDVVTHIDICFLKIFLWERFKGIDPRSMYSGL